MGGGSINNPESEYHLEILFRDKNNINEVSKILEKLIKYVEELVNELVYTANHNGGADNITAIVVEL